MENSHPALVSVAVEERTSDRVHLHPDDHHYKETIPVISFEGAVGNRTTWCYEKETDTAVLFGTRKSDVPSKFETVGKSVQSDPEEDGDTSGDITISSKLPDEIFEPIKQSDSVELWVVSPDNSEWDIGYAYVYPAGRIKQHNQ